MKILYLAPNRLYLNQTQQLLPILFLDIADVVFLGPGYVSEEILNKGEIVYSKQGESKATTYNYIRTPKDSEIDFNKPLKELYNEIRACDANDYPAFFYHGGEKICIKLWRYNKEDNSNYTI